MLTCMCCVTFQVAFTFLDDHGREVDKLTYKVRSLIGQSMRVCMCVCVCGINFDFGRMGHIPQNPTYARQEVRDRAAAIAHELLR